jgi:hypothetical protein
MKTTAPDVTPVHKALFLGCLIASAPALHGLDLSSGEVDARLDITLSIGGSYRVQSAHPNLVGLANGGTQFSVNADDGNLNYKKGWISAPVLASADLQLGYRNSGVFLRANAFYDYVNKDRDRERTPLTDAAMERVGTRYDMLDAYFWTNFDAGAIPVNLRLGRQVLNWGESTFIQNGINAVNPVDVSKLRLPGSELRDAFLPIWMAAVSAGITENVTLEAFYQFRWKEVIIDPPGTYFSTNDFVGRGGDKVYLGFGAIGDGTPFGAIPRGDDQRPGDAGQFGIAARIYSPALNGTEFGLYYLNYHSRVPVLSARTPTTPINTNLTGPLTMVFMQAGLPAEQAAAQAQGLFQLLAILQTQGPAALTPEQLATVQAPQSQAAISGASQIALLTSAATGRYLVEYPEGIHLVGASFNTDIGTTGVSLQGEISYRWNQPLQVDDVELLFSALSSINPGFGAVNQMGDLLGQLDTYVRGWQREKVWQAQATATKVFGPTLGADQAVFLIEAGITYVPDLPDKDVLRFEAPGTFLGGSAAATAAGLQPATEPAGNFADGFSWGYRAVAKLDYFNLFMSTNISPILQFAHDVSGTTPQPLGNFVTGRKSATLAIEATYQNSWSANISYTNYFGAGARNLIRDRDFVSATVKYSF